MMKTAAGTSNSMKKINRKTLAEFKLPLPSIEIQEKIVAEFNEQKKHQKAITHHLSKTREMLLLLTNKLIGGLHV